MEKKQWDIFISHASEDKYSIVKDLAKELDSYGVKVWYDEFTLRIGDSLSRSIDKGLVNSNYGLVVLSPAFLSKNWPEYELRGLIALESGHEKVILPIWHNVTREVVLEYSPTLADKLALSTKDNNYKDLTIKIVEIVRPDIFEKIMQKLTYEKSLTRAKINLTDIKSINFPPIIHKELPNELIIRIRLIRASLLQVYPHSMEYWVEGFKRDAHPTKQIEWWEFLSTCFLEYIQIRELSEEQYKSAFHILLCLLNNGEKRVLKNDIKLVTRNGYNELCNVVKYYYPFYDIEDELPQNIKDLSDFDLDEYKIRYAVEDFD